MMSWFNWRTIAAAVASSPRALRYVPDRTWEVHPGSAGTVRDVSKLRVRAMVTRERAWSAESWITGVLGAMVAERLIRAAYRAIRKQAPDSAFDLDSVRFSWPNFVVWALAGGIGLGLGKLVSNRVATVGWEIATGTRPPKDTEGHTPN
jgi:hypothetical protein